MGIKEELEKKYGLKIKLDTATKKNFPWQPPEVIHSFLINLMMQQNVRVLEKKAKELTDYVATTIGPKVYERLKISSIGSPKVKLSKGYNGHLSLDIDGVIKVGRYAMLRTLTDGFKQLQKRLLHEFGHFLSLQLNTAPIPKLTYYMRFDGKYGKGHSQDKFNLPQVEGFANWLAGLREGFADTDQELREKIPRDEWSRRKFLRQLYDDPYSLGGIVYRLAEQTYGINAVKDIAFNDFRTRQDFEQLYRDLCKKLDLEPISFPSRYRKLQEVYQEMIELKVITPDDELESTTKTIDQKIKKLDEPRILNFFKGSLISDFLIEAYWHYGVIVFDSEWLTETNANIKNGDRIDAQDQLDTKVWNVFINDRLWDVDRDICKKNNIVYMVDTTIKTKGELTGREPSLLINRNFQSGY